MNKIITNIVGGQPISMDDIAFMDQSTRDAFYGFLSAFGQSKANSFILNGVNIIDNGTDFSWDDGYISLEGEILRVEAGSFAKVTPVSGYAYAWTVDLSYDPSGSKVFFDLSSHSVYQVRLAVIDYVPTSSDYMPALAGTIYNKIHEKLIFLESDWQSVTMNNDWYSQPGNDLLAKVDIFGEVHMQGAVIFDNSIATGLLFTLPNGYRPSKAMEVPVITSSGIKVATINSNGEVSITDTLNRVVFDCISFKI